MDRPLIVAVALAAMSLFGCRWIRGQPGPSADQEKAVPSAPQQAEGVTFSEVSVILRRSCADTCHDGKAMAADDFVFRDDGDLRERLLGVAPSTAPLPCQNRPLVQPGQPDRSLLFAVIDEPDPPRAECAERMPYNCPQRRPCLSANDVTTIRTWIEQGARP